ncbi:MAG TPA: HDOD domain-containing protein [Rhodocyclaceae bacterium]|nr:HDOD domain-containing protein [Rhodocyclaceae bacterium]
MQQVPDSIVDALEALHLPSMPQVLLRFLRLAEDERISIEELAEVVGRDPALAAHVMIAANSAALRRGQEAKTLGQCLAALGGRLVRIMAACLAVQSVFAGTAGDRNHDLGGFWLHSLQVAELARLLALRLGRPDVEEIYLAGLLHDVGELLLLGGMNGRYGALLAWSRDEEALLALENAEFGIDHAAAGAWLVDQWRLSSFMADAVLFHHSAPSEIGAADPASRIVWAAHAVARWAANDDGRLSSGQQFEAGAIESMLELPASSLATLRDQAAERVARTAAEFGIDVPGNASTLPRSARAAFEGAWPEQPATQDQVGALVRDMAIMQPLQEGLFSIESEAELLLGVRESARILFGAGRMAFLLTDNDDGLTLAGADIGSQPALLQRLVIPIKAGASLAAAAALGDGHPSTFEQGTPLSLVDVQVARALGTAGVLYLPMRTRDRLIGVIACGFSEAQYARCKPRLPWMASLARVAAVSLQSRRDLRARALATEADMTSRFARQARRVVHEAGNPLAIITNYLKIVSERIPSASGVRQELDILKEEIDRVAQIVQQLGDVPALIGTAEKVDINAVIDGMAALYRESIFSSCGVTLDLDLDRSLPSVPGNRDQIKQVILNLWRNAADAMHDGGRLSVATTEHVAADGQSFVELRISDTGPGLPADVVANIFQPLDVHRRPGHAGIGLSIVAALVRELGGRISFQSRTGQGTTFGILLPNGERMRS